MSSVRNEQLFRCFCEARKIQGFFTECLNQCCEKEEEDLLAELVKDYTRAANRIKSFCSKNPLP
jgi:hypothetical protein